MKFIRIVLIGLIAFNGILLLTTALGIFDTGTKSYQGKNVTEVSGVDLKNFDSEDIFRIINPLAVGTVLGMMVIAGLVAWKIHSPAPLGAGGALSVYVGIWIQTYTTLQQYPIPTYLFGIGTVLIALLLIFDTIDIMSGRPSGG